MNKNDLFLVIDMQNVYDKGGKWECRSTQQAAQNIIKVIDSSVNNVIFTEFIANPKAKGVWRDYNTKYADVNNDEFANELLECLKEKKAAFPVFKKSVYSSLSIPQVLKEARKAQKKGGRVVVSGVVAECCVLSTVLHLMDEGIYCIYLTDAVSGLDLPKEQATELIFSGLSPLHVKMMTTDEYLNEQ